MNSIGDAQQDMRQAYLGGATGAISSATVWLIAGFVAVFVSSKAGIMTLVFGGMLIFPASVLLCKALGGSAKLSKSNPLAPLAGEGTIWMLLCMLIAIALAFYRIDLFFPAMLLIIGGRYLTFATLYGMKIYWAFGAALAIAAAPLAVFNAPVAVSAFTGALIEYMFAIAIFVSLKRQN